MLENAFLVAFGTVCVDFEWILKGPKLAVFEQKPWAIAHGFENGGFGSGLEIAPNSLKRFLYARKCVSSCFRDCLCRFWVNSQGSEIGRFWEKAWAIAHGFENGGFGSGLEIARNSLKRFLYARKCVSSCFRDCLCRFWVNSQVSEIGRFWEKAWAIAHGFENGGFGSGLEIAPNSLKRFLYARKCVSSCFGSCLCRFWVNSQGSEIGRFWAKTLGYSPWFWKWRIWVRGGNRSKLSETLPLCSQMRF